MGSAAGFLLLSSTTMKKVPTTTTEPLATRKRLAAAYRKRSTDKRLTPAERADFARMADAWERTLPKK
jgi:hypothetical protein